MIDYLEQQLRSAGALLEQVRKMERSASGLPQERGEAAEDGESAGEEAEMAGETGREGQLETGEAEAVDDLKRVVDGLEKRVDEVLSVPEPGREPAEDGGEPERERAEDVWPERSSVRLREEDGREEPAGPEASNEERAEVRNLPLAARLEELDRAVSALAALPQGRGAGAGGESLFPAPAGGGSAGGFPGMAGGGWSGLGGGTPGTAGGEPNWTEETDRAFRRDSRRYDGGFYLY